MAWRHLHLHMKRKALFVLPVKISAKNKTKAKEMRKKSVSDGVKAKVILTLIRSKPLNFRVSVFESEQNCSRHTNDQDKY